MTKNCGPFEKDQSSVTVAVWNFGSSSVGSSPGAWPKTELELKRQTETATGKRNLLMRISLILLLGAFAPLACGVRGRPQPPLTPAEIGRGQPTFKRASGEDSFKNVPLPDADTKPEPTPTQGRPWNSPSESN